MDLRKLCAVALHPEGVDRNREISVAAVAACIVALHPEGVDRNDTASKKLWTYPVALHPEGVDRNRTFTIFRLTRNASPSTRRAWIEIAYAGGHWLPRVVALHPEGVDRNPQSGALSFCSHVALHPEGVDRNRVASALLILTVWSPPTRRAWIEI